MGTKFSGLSSQQSLELNKQNKKTFASCQLPTIQVLQIQRSEPKSKQNGGKRQDQAYECASQNLCERIYENNRKRRWKNGKYNSMNLENKENYNPMEGRKKNSSDKEAPKRAEGQIRAHLSNIQMLSKNKKLVSESIEAIECVSSALKKLNEAEILRGQQYKYLCSKNKNSLNNKQKRFNNLEAREKRLKLSLPKIEIAQDRLDRKKSISTFMSNNSYRLRDQKIANIKIIK